MDNTTLKEDFGRMSSSESDPLLHTSVSAECISQDPPPIFIRFLAQVMTGLHFLESVGATFVLRLCPSLAPEPRLHQYISTPGGSHEHRRHSHLPSRPNGIVHTSSANPRRRNSRVRISSIQNYDCFLDQADGLKFAAQREEILAIFEQHNDGGESGPMAL